MKASFKKKINLTIDEHVIEKAKQIAEHRGSSLSALVEGFLRQLSEDMQGGGSDWISGFHRKYLGAGYKEPSDTELSKLKAAMRQKYS